MGDGDRDGWRHWLIEMIEWMLLLFLLLLLDGEKFLGWELGEMGWMDGRKSRGPATLCLGRLADSSVARSWSHTKELAHRDCQSVFRCWINLIKRWIFQSYYYNNMWVSGYWCDGAGTSTVSHSQDSTHINYYNLLNTESETDASRWMGGQVRIRGSGTSSSLWGFWKTASFGICCPRLALTWRLASNV